MPASSASRRNRWTRRQWFGAAALASALLTGVVCLSALRVKTNQWRVQAVVLKLRGGLDDLTWGELTQLLRPGAGFQLWYLVKTGNPYTAISNPYAAETAAGAEVFRSHCASCHGPGGEGGSAPDLTDDEYHHGASDWAMFRAITRGIAGTGMKAVPVTTRQAWQLVAFLRSASAPSKGAKPAFEKPAVSVVTDERLRNSAGDPGNWLMYSGSFDGTRYSRLDQIAQHGVSALGLKWVYQLNSENHPVEATPLVVDDVMYVSEPPGNVLALDAVTGRVIWRYRRALPSLLRTCCQYVNRGVAIMGTHLYVGTLDAHLVALDRASGHVVWDVEVAKPADGFSITGAPLTAAGKVLIGVAGGEFAIRGFLDAYDAQTGQRRWRFHTTPAPGEPGHDTWSGDSWKTGGGPTWLTGSFDPELNTIYWGVGNPAPGFRSDERKGDNLYSNSVVALDIATGRLRWHFQFTPNDEHDWDANQIPVLVDRTINGVERKLMLWANRNGFYYVLDRETGRFVRGVPFVKQTWTAGLTAEGRPLPIANGAPSRQGTVVWPGRGGTNFWSPSFSPAADLFYVHAHERSSIFLRGSVSLPSTREFFEAGVQGPSDEGRSLVRALNPESGALVWEYQLGSGPSVEQARGGVLSTAGNLVFAGNGEGLFVALDAKNGRELWRTHLGGAVYSSPITFMSGGTQLVTIAAGRNLFTFQRVESAPGRVRQVADGSPILGTWTPPSPPRRSPSP